MTVQILQGDARRIAEYLPDESVHCVVTSPPYFGLRDYGVDGQIGLEATPDAFVAEMVGVFSEVRRVLKNDGVLWLNLGDSYAGGGHGGGGSFQKERNWRQNPTRHLAGAVVATRSGVTDGETSPFRPGSPAKNGGKSNRDGLGRVSGLKPKDLIGIPWRVAFALQADGWYLRQDIIWSKPNPMPESVCDRCTKAHEYIFMLTKSARYYFDADAIAEPAIKRAAGSNFNSGKTATHQAGRTSGAPRKDRGTRNKRSVWVVPPAAFKEGHFATFPPKLIEPCILAGCPEGGTVLDPFGGAGTTGLVAQQHKRNAILIELNPDYCAMARARIDRAAA